MSDNLKQLMQTNGEDDELTIDEAVEELMDRMSTRSAVRVVGFTSAQLVEKTGWGIGKVRKELRKLAESGELVRKTFPVVSLLDGKAYPVIHYSLKKE